MSEQDAQQQEEANDLLAVNDLDHFITLLTDWHNHQVATVKHLQEVPNGITVVIGEGDDAAKKTLEGEFLEGFQLGLGLALNYFSKLPFVAEYVDADAIHH